MSTGETLSSAANAAKERSEAIAVEVAEKAAEAAAKMLERHKELLGPGLIEQVVKIEWELARDEALQAREEGRMNDNRSIGLGFTAFITSEAVERLRQYGQENDVAYFETYLSTAEAVEETADVYRIRFAEGVYMMGFGGASIYGKAVLQEPGYWIDEEDPMSIGYSHIIRIEGDAGELWQNWERNPDGSKKQA